MYKINAGEGTYLEVLIKLPLKRQYGIILDGCFDTGAQVSVIDENLIRSTLPELLPEVIQGTCKLHGAGGTTIPVLGTIKLACIIEGRNLEQEFVVAPIVKPMFLGLDFMRKHKASWDWHKNRMIFQDSSQGINLCMMDREVQIEKQAMQCETFKVDTSLEGTEVLIQNVPICENIETIQGLYLVDQGKVRVPMINSSTEDFVIAKGTVVAKCFAVEQVQTCKPADEAPEQVQTHMPNKTLPEELEKLITPLDGKYEPEQVEKFRALLIKYRGIFALKGEPLGRTGIVKHEINVDNKPPIRQAPRRIPIHQVDTVETAMKEMQDAGVIRPSESPWASPIVLVKKKDGTTRFCIDFRRLNEVTVKDAYPLPRIEDNLDALVGSKYFSTLDMASGYWQVEMSDTDKAKTAFATRYGLWEWNVMPFGLCNAPATFQRLMERVLAGLQWRILALYLDDVIVFASSIEDHLNRLEEVFKRCQEAGLKLKPKKCSFLQESVQFLGHLVDAKGVHTDPEKIEKIQNWPTPTSVTEVRTFVGLTSYYRRFIKNYAEIASPLHNLTKKDIEFNWSEDCDQAMTKLKQELIASTVLAFPNKDGGEFILDTDASNTAIGAVLSQIQEGKERVIAYGSRCLNSPEKNYCVTRRELLAVVYFIDYYRHYLVGRKFKVRTDHGSLRWLSSRKNPTGQVARWIERLAPFQFEIEHRAGKKHGNADALSRYPCPGTCTQCEKMNNQTEMEEPKLCQAILMSDRVADLPVPEVSSHWDLDELAKATKADPDLSQVLDWEIRPPWEIVSTQSAEVKHYWNNFGRLRQDQRGLLWYQWVRGDNQFAWKLMLPQNLRQEIIKVVHDCPTAGHLAFERCWGQLERLPVYWCGHKRDLQNHCKACDACLRNKPVTRKIRHQMVSFSAGEPLERMAVDICGPLHESEQGNKYIIVLMDYFTKWCELIPVQDHTAKTVAQELVSKVFTKIGVPLALHSDQGTEFLSSLFQETCELFGIQKTRTTPWRPQSDGLVERLNRTIGAMLRQYVAQDQKDWDYWLPFVSMAYNSTIQASTKHSPYYLMFGRDMKLPIELVLPTPEEDLLDEWIPITPATYIENMTQRLKETFHLVRKNLNAALAWQRRAYNGKQHTVPLHAGQGVWLFNPITKKGRTPKLDTPWQGPYAIVKLFGKVLAEIKKHRRSPSKIVHVDKLIPMRGAYDGSWVKNLPARERLEGVERLFAKDDEGNPSQQPHYAEPVPERQAVKPKNDEYKGPITRSRAKQNV